MVDFSNLLESASTECKEMLVMGDININLLSDSSTSMRLQSISEELSLTQLIAEPTRVTEDTRTMIDQIYTSNPGSFLESGRLDARVSDHLRAYRVRSGGQCHGHKTKKVRTFKRCNVEGLLDDLQSASWEISSTDIDSLWNHWKSTFLDILDSHAPMVSCRVRRNSLPWIDADSGSK